MGAVNKLHLNMIGADSTSPRSHCKVNAAPEQEVRRINRWTEAYVNEKGKMRTRDRFPKWWIV